MELGDRRGSGGGRSLILFAHPDGEPLAGLDRWRHDPFGGTIADGRLHGWGVADDLSGVALMIEGLRAIEHRIEKVQEARTPSVPVRIETREAKP
mgnify:CR=1 FL=1